MAARRFRKPSNVPILLQRAPPTIPALWTGLSKLHRSSLLTNSVALSRSDSFAPRSGRGGGDRSKKQHYRVARQQPPAAASSQPHRRIPRRNRTPSTARSHRHRSGRTVTPRQGPDPERFLPGHPSLGCARGPPLGRRERACERNSSEIPRGQVDPVKKARVAGSVVPGGGGGGGGNGSTQRLVRRGRLLEGFRLRRGGGRRGRVCGVHAPIGITVVRHTKFRVSTKFKLTVGKTLSSADRWSMP